MNEQSAREIRQTEETGADGFDLSLKESGLYPYRAIEVNTLQVNLGDLCNQTCTHCHVQDRHAGLETGADQGLAPIPRA